MNRISTENEASGEIIEVDILPLDTFLGDAKPPALLKIDVEGFEQAVLLGGQDTLDAPELKAIVIELNGSGIKYGFRDEEVHQFRNKGDGTFEFMCIVPCRGES